VDHADRDMLRALSVPAGAGETAEMGPMDGTSPRRIVDLRTWSVCALFAAILIYLAFEGGGYDLIVRNQVGLGVWWGVMLCAAVGALPRRPLPRASWVVLSGFGAFVLWTVVATAHSQSAERSLAELSRVACYFGVLVLAVALHRDRDRAIALTVVAVAVSVTVVAFFALLSRLLPGSFPASTQTAAFLPGTSGRLDWPLNYWNGLAAMMALGLPLLLAIAGSAQSRIARALAAAAIPLVVLCAYLTFSRGGALAIAGGVIVYFIFTEDRLPKLLTALLAAGGGALLIAIASHSSAVEKGLENSLAHHQGHRLLAISLVVAAGVGLGHTGIGVVLERLRRPRWLVITPRSARRILLGAIVVAVAVALAAGAPHRLSHAWDQFKQGYPEGLHSNSLARFGTASGNGRYDYWKVAFDATSQHLITGWGPGTFQLIWLAREPYYSYVINAHSLYFETLVEDGVVGLAVLLTFLIAALGTAALLAARTRGRTRVLAAAVTAACTSFAISAAVDWVWQIPVLVFAFLLLIAATLAPDKAPSAEPAADGTEPESAESRTPRRRRAVINGIALRVGLIGLSIAAIGVIVVPLASTTALRRSETAATKGDLPLALSDARAAASIEPDSASAQIQIALDLEIEGQLGPAIAAARHGIANEPLNWSSWLVLSRLEAESGNPAAAVSAYRQARSLNPKSPLFSIVLG
jgi:O-antigen ligase/polysaccharide polymerase Wzy-like membrane protein